MMWTTLRCCRKQSVIIAWAILLGLLGVFGCGLSHHQLAKIQSFSPAATTLGDLAADNFTRLRNDQIALSNRKRSIEARLPSDEPGDTAGAGPTATPPMLPVEQLEIRLAATAALTEFGRLLAALATDDYSPRLQAHTNAFLSNLQKVEGVQLSDAQAQAIGTLVVQIGGLLIDYRRAEALRLVVAETDQPVRSVIRLLKEDFDPDTFTWASALRQTKDEIEGELKLTIDTLEMITTDQGDSGTSGSLSPLTRADLAVIRTEYEKLRADAQKRWAAYLEIRPRLEKALRDFATAHGELAQVMREPEFDAGSIDGFLIEMEALVRLYRAVRQS